MGTRRLGAGGSAGCGGGRPGGGTTGGGGDAGGGRGCRKQLASSSQTGIACCTKSAHEATSANGASDAVRVHAPVADGANAAVALTAASAQSASQSGASYLLAHADATSTCPRQVDVSTAPSCLPMPPTPSSAVARSNAKRALIILYLLRHTLSSSTVGTLSLSPSLLTFGLCRGSSEVKTRASPERRSPARRPSPVPAAASTDGRGPPTHTRVRRGTYAAAIIAPEAAETTASTLTLAPSRPPAATMYDCGIQSDSGRARKRATSEWGLCPNVGAAAGLAGGCRPSCVDS